MTRKPKAIVITFKGSNCENEAINALIKMGFDAQVLWYDDKLPDDMDLCLLAGGFSYGDYLRSGAISSSLPIIKDVRNFAENGGLVIGVCNGFQILTEAKMLPGALLPNVGGHFLCTMSDLKCRNVSSAFTSSFKSDESIRLQSAHAHGQYYADKKTLDDIANKDMIAFTYQDNFNGSKMDIAGIISGKNNNILGLMPHPERFMESVDGLRIFQNIYNYLT